MNNYHIRQYRDSLNYAHISSNILSKLLSDFDEEYYKLLAIISKIYDENPEVFEVEVRFKFIDDLITITGLYCDDKKIDKKEMFTENNIKYKD